MFRGGIALLSAVVVLALAPAAWAGHMGFKRATLSQTQSVAEPCPGDPISPDRVFQGRIGADHIGDYLLVPFDVPRGTTAVRVKYCFDQPEEQRFLGADHRLDFGLFGPRRNSRALWGEREFIGWGGFSHHDVTVSARGFSSETLYRQNPGAHVPGKTTRAFAPERPKPGQWAAELGIANVVSRAEGDATGEVAYRVEVELSRKKRFSKPAYHGRPYDSRPARRHAGWYAGDLHVHGEHSTLGDALMRDIFDYGFSRNGGRLDWLTMSDHVNDSAWPEIRRFQDDYPGKLIIRSSEVITYRGHLMNHASGRFVEYRTGRIYELLPDGGMALRRGARAPRAIFDEIHAKGGFTQVAHPVNFDSPATRAFCSGCTWDYSSRETDWSAVDAYEVHTGPANIGGPPDDPIGNPFTPTAIAEWDRLRRRGYDITGVAASDAHFASRRPDLLQSEVGNGTTVVYAPELSEPGISEGIRAGRAYVKIFGPDSPDLRLSGTAGGRRAIMGDTLRGAQATLTARVFGGVPTDDGRTLVLYHDGRAVESVPITRRHFAHRFKVSGPGEYRIQVMRGNLADALTNPIRLVALGR